MYSPRAMPHRAPKLAIACLAFAACCAFGCGSSTHNDPGYTLLAGSGGGTGGSGGAGGSAGTGGSGGAGGADRRIESLRGRVERDPVTGEIIPKRL